MNRDKKLNGLKMTYIGQLISDGTGVGGGTRLKNTISIFKKIGIKIDLISFSFYSNKFCIEHKKIDSSLQITTVHIPKNIPTYLKAFAILPVFVYAWKSCRNRDIIFSDFITEIAYVPATILKKIFNKPLILDFIDTKFFKEVPECIKRYAAKNADIIFAISYYLLEFARREYNSKSVVYIPNYIDTNHFKIDWETREKIRNALGIKKDDVVIEYVGSFQYYEGLPILLQAFKELTKRYSKIKLAIMGKIYAPKSDDDITGLIEDMDLQSDVILIPSQPHEEVPKFLSACDITCCPKIDCEINRAANPVKVVEYLSMGLPTVCSAVGGISDTIEGGVDGLLVKPGDVKDLEEKLEWIILNPERSKEIGENGRKKAIGKYSYESFENTIKQAISEVIEMKRVKKRT